MPYYDGSNDKTSSFINAACPYHDSRFLSRRRKCSSVSIKVIKTWKLFKFIRLLKTCGELTLQRRTHRMSCMSILLEFANHYNTSIRIWALDQIVSIYSKLYSSTGPWFNQKSLRYKWIDALVSQYCLIALKKSIILSVSISRNIFIISDTRHHQKNYQIYQNTGQ